MCRNGEPIRTYARLILEVTHWGGQPRLRRLSGIEDASGLPSSMTTCDDGTRPMARTSAARDGRRPSPARSATTPPLSPALRYFLRHGGSWTMFHPDGSPRSRQATGPHAGAPGRSAASVTVNVLLAHPGSSTSRDGSAC